MTIIDTHVHLDHIEHLDTVLNNAREAGVESIIAVGVDLASNKKNLEIQQKTDLPKIHVALGIHPGNIKSEEIDECLHFIRDNINRARAIGEIGLDFWYKWVRNDKAKKAEQRNVFLRQLELALEFDLPAIIHTRGTWRECFETAKTVGIKKAVFHWYAGPLDVLDDMMAHGYYVSASPSIAYSPQSREAISRAPIERTLIETDTPVFFQYRDGQTQACTPIDRIPEGHEFLTGFVSQPRDVLKTLAAYADLKQIPSEKALEILNHNAKQFFHLNIERKS